MKIILASVAAFTLTIGLILLLAFTATDFNRLDTSGQCQLDLSYSDLQSEQISSFGAVQIHFENDKFLLSMDEALSDRPIGKCFKYCDRDARDCDGCYASCVDCRDRKNSITKINCVTSNCSRFGF